MMKTTTTTSTHLSRMEYSSGVLNSSPSLASIIMYTFFEFTSTVLNKYSGI